MKKAKLNHRLVTGGILAVLIPLFIVGIFSVTKASKALENMSRDRAVHIATNLSDMVSVMLEEELKLAAGLSSSNAVVDATSKITEVGMDQAVDEIAALGKELSNAKKRLGMQYEVLSVTNSKGTVIADGVGGRDKGIDLSNRAYFKSAKSGQVNVSNPVKSKSSGKPVVPVVAPIYSRKGEIVGTLVAVLKIDYLCEKLATIKIGESGYPFMIDKKGVIIAHPDQESVFKLNVKDMKGMESIGDLMLSQQTGVESYVYNGEEKIGAFAPIKLTGWSINVCQSSGEFLGAAHAIRNMILIVGAVFMAITLLAVVYFARSITKPIQKIIEELNEGADQVASASAQVSSASQSLAEGASDQAASIEETSSSLEEMSSMTKQNADNATEANNLMKEANHIVGNANDSMQDLTGSMEEITKASEETSKIIKTIDEIAFQTNLLALNAAVEAARAGEAGSGFAVVADEVRNLAMRAAEAAKNTAGLIEGTVKKIKDGSDLVTKTNEAFSEVSRTSSRVGELVAEIAAASSEQAGGIEQVNLAVAEMDKIVQQNAASAEESASASEEMNAQAEQMKASVNDLVLVIQGGKNHSGGAKKDRGERKRRGKEQKKVAAGARPKYQVAPIGKDHRIPEEGRTKQVSPEQVIPMEEEDFRDF